LLEGRRCRRYGADPDQGSERRDFLLNLIAYNLIRIPKLMAT
jgi:hypothetical protein